VDLSTNKERRRRKGIREEEDISKEHDQSRNVNFESQIA